MQWQERDKETNCKKKKKKKVRRRTKTHNIHSNDTFHSTSRSYTCGVISYTVPVAPAHREQYQITAEFLQIPTRGPATSMHICIYTRYQYLYDTVSPWRCGTHGTIAAVIQGLLFVTATYDFCASVCACVTYVCSGTLRKLICVGTRVSPFSTLTSPGFQVNHSRRGTLYLLLLWLLLLLLLLLLLSWNRYFYPTTSAAHPVPVLILPPIYVIQILWSHTCETEKTKK